MNTLVSCEKFGIDEVYGGIFEMQQHYLNHNQQDKIKNSHIALAGLGGIGGYVLESLVRNGFGNLRISEHDVFEKSNYRQIYMTLDNIGKAKIDSAGDRIQSLNPFCSVTEFPGGIKPNNAYAFCNGADVIIQQTDSIAAFILLKYWASKLRLPHLHGSRKHWLQSRQLTVALEDYRDDTKVFEWDANEISDRYGVPVHLLKEYFVCIESETNNDDLEKQIQNENATHRKRTVQKMVDALEFNKLADFTGGNEDIEHIRSNIVRYPNKFDKLRVAPEQVMIIGAMVTSVVKDIVLERQISIPLLAL